jgi:hemerythrin
MIHTQNAAVEALNKAHVQLKEELRGLENLVRNPDKMEPNDTTYHLVNLRQHLLDHFRLEEEGGYMDVVAQREPNLHREMEQLKEDHKRLAAGLDALIADARMGQAGTAAFAQRVRDWVASVRRHEADENRLLQDAFTLDVTAED